MAAKADRSWIAGARREKSQYVLEIGRRKTQVRLKFGKVVLGRHPKLCHVIFQAALISRQHCGIVVTREEITIQDLKSRNGTLVNGTQIDHVHLQPGDVISIGGVNIKVVVLAEKPDIQTPEADTDHTNLATEPLLPNPPSAHLFEELSGEIPDDILNTLFEFDDD